MLDLGVEYSLLMLEVDPCLLRDILIAEAIFGYLGPTSRAAA